MMCHNRNWLLRWGPVVILFVSSVLSIQSWNTYRVTAQLWSEREKATDLLRIEELAALIEKRTDVETHLEQARWMRRAENEALVQKLERSLRRFEQSEEPVQATLNADVVGAPNDM